MLPPPRRALLRRARRLLLKTGLVTEREAQGIARVLPAAAAPYLAAALTADAECRQLACVVGQADDRLETELFESYSDAEAAFANRRDLCGARAVAAGCDAEDLVGIGTDEEPN